MHFRSISVNKEFADFIEKVIAANPHFGYKSIADFMQEAARQRLESMGVLHAANPTSKIRASALPDNQNQNRVNQKEP